MNTERDAHTPVGSLSTLLPLLFLLTGLFAMHGLQASADPTEHTGVTIAAAMPGMESAHAAPGTSFRAGPSPSHGSPHHGHTGGQMCLGLPSTMTALLVLAGIITRPPVPPARGTTAARGFARQGRSPPPPSIFELSVLRT